MAKQQQQFIKLYYDAIVALGITDAVVYCYLLGYGDKCHPSIKDIADMCGLSLRTVKRSLATLTEKGLLVYNVGKGTRNQYEVKEVPNWHTTCAKMTLPKCQNDPLEVPKRPFESAKMTLRTDKIILDYDKIIDKNNSLSLEARTHEAESFQKKEEPQEETTKPPVDGNFLDLMSLYKEVREDIENHCQWVNEMQYRLKIPDDQLLILLEEFQSDRFIEDEHQCKTRRDYRNHFHNFLKRRIQNGQPTNNSKKQQQQPTYSSDFLKSVVDGLNS